MMSPASSRILSISIDAIPQRKPEEGEDVVDVIILTHRSIEKHVDAAITRIESPSTIAGKVVRIRLKSC